jgi:hypothetical protein
MEMQTELGFQALFNHIVGGMAQALCDRPGETKEQQFARFQGASHTIMAFSPRDPIEAVLASRCVMFHELIVDSAHDTLHGEANPKLRAARGNIVAMDRAFGANLTRLEKYQTRKAEGRRESLDAAAAGAVGEREIGDRVKRHRTEAAADTMETHAAEMLGSDTAGVPHTVGAGQEGFRTPLRAAGEPRVKPADDELGAADNGLGVANNGLGIADSGLGVGDNGFGGGDDGSGAGVRGAGVGDDASNGDTRLKSGERLCGAIPRLI